MSVKIIAEIAQGYEGKPDIAELLARAALRSDADAVKFQCVFADELAVPQYMFYDLFRKLEMSQSQWKEIVEMVTKEGKEFYFDIFGEHSFNTAADLNVEGVKIHATDFFNTKLIHRSLEAFSKVFISFGGISIEELKQFYDDYNIKAKRNICFMFGYQTEPTPLDKNNIMRLKPLRQFFPNVDFGFMDHSDAESQEAMTIALLTLPFGVGYIEKHIGLDRHLTLEDYVSALTPTEFQKFVQKIRRHEIALGSDDIRLTETEKNYREKVLKVVVAKNNLKKGDKIDEDLISLKRPVEFSASAFYRQEDVIGRILIQDIRKNDIITMDSVK